MTDRPLTRRELRELERAGVPGGESNSGAQGNAGVDANSGPDFAGQNLPEPAGLTSEVQESPGRVVSRDTAEQAIVPVFYAAPAAAHEPEPVALPGLDEEQASPEQPVQERPVVEELFPRSGPIDIVVDTNSIVIEMPKDITNSTLVVPDSGVVLTTGSITLPNIKADTGEITVIAAAEAADTALASEKREFAVTGIEPLPARRHMRSRKRSSVFPTRLRKGMGQVYLVLFSAIITAAVLGILAAAYMLGIIHF